MSRVKIKKSTFRNTPNRYFVRFWLLFRFYIYLSFIVFFGILALGLYTGTSSQLFSEGKISLSKNRGPDATCPPNYVPECIDRNVVICLFVPMYIMFVLKFVQKLPLPITSSIIHSGYFYSASSRPLLVIGAPDYSINVVSELTRRSAIGNCEWRTCPRIWSLRGG